MAFRWTLFFQFFLVTLVVGLVSTATAAQVTLNPSKDNTLYESSTGDLSNGAGDRLFAGVTGGGGPGVVRALLAFDIAAGIPSGATINSVQLTMQVPKAAPNSGGSNVGLHRVSQDWGEGTSVGFGGQGGGGTTATNDATWIHTFSDTSTWNNPGGDFEATASAVETFSLFDEETAVWNSTAGLVADVQNWLNNPSTNFGWMIVGNESTDSTAYAFSSRENTADAPALLIDFSTGAALSGLAGDYNNNFSVDAADYTLWRDNLSATPGTLLNDTDGGTIGTDQYATWKTNFGISASQAGVAVTAVPEPASLWGAVALSCMVAIRKRCSKNYPL